MKNWVIVLTGLMAIILLAGLTGCYGTAAGEDLRPMDTSDSNIDSSIPDSTIRSSIPENTIRSSTPESTLQAMAENRMDGIAMVLPCDSGPETKDLANSLKVTYGNLIQICDGTNDEVQLQTALDALPPAGGTVYLTSGTFHMTNTVKIRSNISLTGSEGTVIRSALPESCLFENDTGYDETTVPLAADLKSNSTELTVSDASDFTVYDWIKITDNTIIGGRDVGKQGELARIKSINNNTITLSRPVVFSYSVSQSANIRKISFTENVSFNKLHVIGPGTNTRSMMMDLITVSGFSLSNCRIENFGIGGVILTDSLYVRIKDNHFENVYESGLGYPVLLYNATENVLITGNTFKGKANHHIAQGARTGAPVNGGIVRFVEIINNTFEGSNLAAIDAHTPYYGPLIVRENYFTNSITA